MLRRCVGVHPDVFAAEYWSRRPLLSTAPELPPGGFGDLLTLDAVDELLSRRGVRTPFVRVAKAGQVLPSSAFTGSGGAGAEVGDQVLDERVLDLFLDGNTVVLQGLHRCWPPLIAFAGRLAAEIGHPVGVNAYLTPAHGQGFSAHYDVHDVFVLQLAGEKRWLVHAPVQPAPLSDQPWTRHRAAVLAASRGAPAIDVVLRPGDALYLPRGYLHAANALGQLTAHLTVGVHALTRYTLVEALAEMAADEPELRLSLPLGVDAADPGQLDADLAATVDALVARLRRADPAEVAARLRRRLWSAIRPEPVSPVTQAAALSEVDSSTLVRLRANLRPLFGAAGAHVTLDLADRRITLPASTGPALAALLAGATLAVAELPGLSTQDAVVLVRRLLREAVVVRAERASSEPEGPQGEWVATTVARREERGRGNREERASSEPEGPQGGWAQ